ncbi:hypothetical protein [Sorangium atrum]|uniref:Uncharacterized protein n=1 Tax=Sorangium atrum TaxID=2995308 RepID=A0ABT5BZN9_9BACT|nr:hypothetical protein [Sorangium aterium]MDC0679075.1 hypothetical protein [Sorangium aterium]
MAIELSIFLLPPGGAAPPRLPEEDGIPRVVDGGGARVHDALDLSDALGRLHPVARALIERNDAAEPEERRFAASELSPLCALVDDVGARLRVCVDDADRPLRPAAEPLLDAGVCVESAGRLVLVRSGHGLLRVIDDLDDVRRALSWAESHGWAVACDFDLP